MEKYCCHNCGRDSNDRFVVSIGEVFCVSAGDQQDYALYLLLHEGVQLSDDPKDYTGAYQFIGEAILAMREPHSAAGAGDDDPDEMISLTELELPGDDDDASDDDENYPGAEEYGDPDIDYSASLKRYQDILKSADCRDLRRMIGYIMDPEHPESTECLRYVWAVTLLSELGGLIRGGNQLLSYMLSVDIYGMEHIRGMEWANIDLRSCLDQSIHNRVYQILRPLTEKSKLEQDSLAAENVIDSMRCVRTASLQFTHPVLLEQCSPEMMPGRNREGSDENNEFLVGLYFGQKSIYKRICPHCGAQIASRLGLYPQKIFSFVGSPSTAKTNIISAMHVVLRHDDGTRIKGLNCAFGVQDPDYAFYDNAYHATLKYLATKKTNRTEFPALTLSLTYEGVTSLYTFVDVPGEYFEAKDTATALSQANMQHMAIMKQSDVICLVVAGEQLRPEAADELLETAEIPDTTRHEFASTQPKRLESIIERVKMFRTNVLGNQDVPVCLVVSKPDALEPREDDYVIVNDGTPAGEQRFWKTGSRTKDRIEMEAVRKLYGMLRENADTLFQQGTPLANMYSLTVIQGLTHRFIGAIHEKADFLNRLFDAMTMNGDWTHIPVFMVSPFGFYAIEDVWKMTEEERLDAFRTEQEIADRLTEEEIGRLARIPKEDLPEQTYMIGNIQEPVRFISSEQDVAKYLAWKLHNAGADLKQMNITQLQEILTVEEQRLLLDLPPEPLKAAEDSIRQQLAQGSKLTLIDMMPNNNDAGAYLLVKCGMQRDDLERILEREYIEKHMGTRRLGVGHLLVWLLVYTGLIRPTFMTGNAEMRSEDEAVSNFLQRNCGVFRRALFLDELGDITAAAKAYYSNKESIRSLQQQISETTEDFRNKESQLRAPGVRFKEKHALKKLLDDLDDRKRGLHTEQERILQENSDIERYFAQTYGHYGTWRFV